MNILAEYCQIRHLFINVFSELSQRFFYLNFDLVLDLLHGVKYLRALISIGHGEIISLSNHFDQIRAQVIHSYQVYILIIYLGF